MRAQYGLAWVAIVAVAAAGCGQSAMSQVKDDLKGAYGSSSYDVAKAEVWPEGKSKVSPEGVTPKISTQCYVPGTTDHTGKRCYDYVGDKLYRRTAVYVKTGADAVSFYKDLAGALSGAQTLVFEHATGGGTLQVLRCSTKKVDGKRVPYKDGSTVFSGIGDSRVAAARDSGRLCASARVVANSRVSRLIVLQSDGAEKYQVSYIDFTPDDALHAAIKAVSESAIEAFKKKHATPTTP